MENGSNFKTWAAHGGGAQSVKFGHDNRLVSAGRDKVVKMWDANGAVQRQFDAFGDIAMRAVFNHDQSKVLGGDWMGQLRTWVAADGKQFAALSTNPATIADQITAATQDVAAKQAAFDGVNTQWVALNANLTKANTEFAAAQKAMVDTAAAAKTALDVSNAGKAQLDAATAALAAQQLKLQAADVKLKAYTQAFATIKASADANKANADLQAFAAQSKTLVDQSTAEFAAVQKVVTDADAALKAMQASYAVLQKAATDTAAVALAAVAQVPVKQAAIKPATDAVNAYKPMFDTATAALATAKATLEKLKATQVASK